MELGRLLLFRTFDFYFHMLIQKPIYYWKNIGELIGHWISYNDFIFFYTRNEYL